MTRHESPATDRTTTLVKTVFDLGARVRGARVFHPAGIPLSGRLHAEPEFQPWFGSGERAVIARVSKGIGTPAAVPDVLGLALRVLDQHEHPWDFALATTGHSLLGRFLITPARAWNSARYGCLLPYRFGTSALTWIFATPSATQPRTTSLHTLREHLHDHPLQFTLAASELHRPARPLAHLELHPAHTHEHRTDFFDPVLNHPTDITLEPTPITRLREYAYQGSRDGRGETGRVTEFGVQSR